MDFFEIKDNIIKYHGSEMKIVKTITFDGKEYSGFINLKEHIYTVMEKITDNVCIEITDKDIRKKVIDSIFENADNFVE